MPHVQRWDPVNRGHSNLVTPKPPGMGDLDYGFSVSLSLYIGIDPNSAVLPGGVDTVSGWYLLEIVTQSGPLGSGSGPLLSSKRASTSIMVRLLCIRCGVSCNGFEPGNLTATLSCPLGKLYSGLEDYRFRMVLS